jgi:hypothetical protein
MDYVAVKGNGVNPEEKEKITQVIRTIAEGFTNQFTSLLQTKEVSEWLNEPHSEEYINQIGKLIQQSTDPLISDFFKGQKINHRPFEGRFYKKSLASLEYQKSLKKKN